MAQLQNGREESQLINGSKADDSLVQLAGRKVNREHFNGNNNTELELAEGNRETSQPLYMNTSHFVVNGTAPPTESELLQHISDAISNFSLNPRPTSELFSSPQAATPRTPAVAPKPSKSKNPHPTRQQCVRGKSASQMGYQFYVNENAAKKVGNHQQVAEAQSESDGENRTLRFVGKRGLTTGDGDDITSAKGTVRGVTNRVRAGIMNFTYKPLNHAKVSSQNSG